MLTVLYKHIESYFLNLIYEAAYCINPSRPDLAKFVDFKFISRISVDYLHCPHVGKSGCKFVEQPMPSTHTFLIEEVKLTHFIKMEGSPVVIELGLCSCGRLIYRC